MPSLAAASRPNVAQLAWPFARWQLDNGLTVVWQPDQRVPLVDIHTVYGAGAAHDPPGVSGLAHLCEHLGLRCPEEGGRPTGQPLVAAQTSLDGTSFCQTRPVRQLEEAFRAEATRMRLSAAPPDILESERQILLRELRETGGVEQSPLELLSGLLFPDGHGYRKSAAGTPEGIRAIRARHVRAFLGHYRPGSAVIVLVGALDRNVMEAAVGKAFGELPKAADDVTDLLPETVDDDASAGHLSVPSAAFGSRVYVACRLPAYGEPGHCAATLAVRCIGVGRRSPLARLLIDQRGLARRVWAHVSRLRSTTLLAFAADGASNVGPDRLRNEMVAALHELAHGSISPRRLEQTRNKALSDLYAYLQRPVVRAEKIALATAFLGNPRYPAEEAEELASVGLDEVADTLDVLRRPERLATLALGSENPG